MCLLLFYCLCTGPSVLQQYSIMASRLTKVPSDFRTGPFHVTAPPLSVFHQEIWLSAFVKRAQLSGKSIVEKYFVFALKYRGSKVVLLVISLRNSLTWAVWVHKDTPMLEESAFNCLSFCFIGTSYARTHKYSCVGYRRQSS